MGQCPTELKQSGKFGNFMCQMAQKHSLGRTLQRNGVRLEFVLFDITLLS